MEYTLDCQECGAEIEVGFDMLMKSVACAACGVEYEVNYDETYNEETGDEFGYFWLEPLTSFGRRK